MDIVALLELLVKGFLQAEEKFYQNLRNLYELEKDVKVSTDAVASGFMGMVLTGINTQLRLIRRIFN